MTEYNTAFVQETREQVRELSSALLDLEDNPDDKETMDAIFRVAHTLKGNAGAMGFDLMNELAHSMEDVLDEVRSGDIEVTSGLVDTMLEHGVDKIETQLNELEEVGEIQTEPTESIAELRSLLPVDSDSVTVAVEEFETGDDGTAITCIAEKTTSDDGERCTLDAQENSNFCHIHNPDSTDEEQDVDDEETVDTETVSETEVTLEAASTDEVTELVDSIDKPSGGVTEAYHVRVLVSDTDSIDSTGQMSALGQLNDAFTVLGTNPDQETIESGEFGRTFDAIISTEIGEENLQTALEGIELVEENVVERATQYADWNEEETVSIDEVEEEIDDDVEVDDLLNEVDEYDDIDDFDEDLIDGIELEQEFGESEGGMFNVKETEPEEPDEPEDSADEDDDENRGSRIFDELKEETEYTDDFDVIEQEMEEVGFDELDDDEMSFDEVMSLDPDDDEEEFDFDDGTVDDGSDEEDLFGGDDTEEEFDGVSIGGETETLEEEDTFDDDEVGDMFGGDDDGTTEQDAEEVFERGFSPSTEEELVEEVEDDDEEVDLGVEVNEQFNTGQDDADDDFDEFGSVFDSDDGDDDLNQFDDILRETGRTPASDRISDGPDIQSIPVDVEELDDLYSLMQELVTNRIRLRRAVEEGRHNPEALAQALDDLDDLEMVSTRMQDTIMNIRLVPLERAVERLPRIARDVAREHDKDVNFSMEGTDVELDRAVLTEISDPLMHLIRNAVDHGIESPDVRESSGKPREGNVSLSARRVRDSIHITVEDDGGGIDADAVRETAVENGLLSEEDAQQLTDKQAYELVFRPGFTTASEVTDTSGRGVGMDVVYSTIRRLDGSIDVESNEGEGTKVNIRVPVSLAIEEVLFLNSGDEEYGIPIKNVDEISYATNIKEVDGREAHMHNGDVYPVVDLRSSLDVPEADSNKGGERLIRISDDVRQVALRCDSVEGQEEIVVEPFDGVLSSIPGLSGAAVLGEGNVINILDVETL